MMKTNFLGKALAIAMMLLGLTFVSCDEFDNPLPADWDGVTPNLPLTLEAVNEGATMNVTFTSTLPETTTIEYSTDGGKSWRFFTISGGKPSYQYGGDPDDWTTWNNQPEIPYSRTISGVHQILIKAENESYGSSEKGDLAADYREGDFRYLNIKVDADCYIYGNVMSMIGGEKFASKTDLSGKYNFFRMFQGNPKLKNHPTKNLLLPATTLADSCYYGMFEDCTALTTAPALPATTLAKECYRSMFNNCAALTTAPTLPATTLAFACYFDMFYGCTALTTAPALPATTLAIGCYMQMFKGCTALETAPELPAEKIENSCYYSMFEGCTALKTAPELPAKKMEKYCYYRMFKDCPSLETAPALPAEELADECYGSMFYNEACTPGYKLKNAPALPAKSMKEGCYAYMFAYCYALETAPELPAETLEKSCYYAMFYNCTALVKAPVLPAKELKYACYWDMFNGCTSLNYIKCLATTGAVYATAMWVFGVPADPGRTFVVADKTKYGAGLFWDPNDWGFSGDTKCMAPTGWTAKNPDEE